MFFHLILENESGDRIDMTATANRYMTSKVEGLSPPPGTISTSSYAGMDGSYLNNAFIEKRNVVIHFEMRGVGIEARRHQLYKVVKPSRYIKIYYKTAGIEVFTEGYVETCEVSNFEMFTTGQISILCPDIYWYATETQTAEYSQVLGAFHFICPDDDKPFPIPHCSICKAHYKSRLMICLHSSHLPQRIVTQIRTFWTHSQQNFCPT